MQIKSKEDIPLILLAYINIEFAIMLSLCDARFDVLSQYVLMFWCWSLFITIA